MEIKVPITPETSQLAITFVEELTQDSICSIGPKLIAALDKDIANTNKLTHPFKHEAYVLAKDFINAIIKLAVCPVVTQ